MSASQVTSLEDLQAYVTELSETTGESKLLILVAILGVLQQEQERCADDVERVVRVGLVRQLVVSEMRRLWTERQAFPDDGPHATATTHETGDA